MTIRNIQIKVLPIFKEQGIKKAAIFGSFVNGKPTKTSDVDFLVKLKSKKSLFDLVELKLALENKLGRKVDVITYNSIHPLLKESILKDQKVIYEEA